MILMPIHCPNDLRLVSQGEFHAIDHRVLGIAYAVHNEFGRLHDESVYQALLAQRCAQAGLGAVSREVPIHVTYDSFRKTYFMDMLIAHGAVYELKAVEAITGRHRAQVINYLLLTGLRHAKTINMRPGSVESKFVSTQLTPEKRYEFTLHTGDWQDLDGDSIWLREMMAALLADWGAFLDLGLFYDAIKHFRGGEEEVVKRIEVVDGDQTVGTQMAHLLNPKVAFKISALTEEISFYEQHLRRFVKHTRLTAIQWINLSHHDITFKTIREEGNGKIIKGKMIKRETKGEEEEASR